MKSLSFSVVNATQEMLLLQFAKQNNIEVETENNLDFVTSPALEKEFQLKTGYSLSEYQQSVLKAEMAGSYSVDDFKNSLSEWKKKKEK
jgi:hypothetical protein